MLVIISGPSGVGKDTIIEKLRTNHPDPRRHFVVTYKTRERRPREVDGVDYHFVSRDEFERLRDAGAFLEATEVHGHWAGTPRDQVIDAITSGRDAILKIDVHGARTVAGTVRDVLRIFVQPPSIDELVHRLVTRNTESEAELERRRRDAAEELLHRDEYDYVVTNETGKPDRTAREIDEILEREHALHPDRRITL